MEAEERELEAISTLRPPSETSRRSSSSSRRLSNAHLQPVPSMPAIASPQSSLQPPNNSESCFLDVPGGSGSGVPVSTTGTIDPEPASPDSRRCSARMLSMNLQHTLRQLRKEEHNSRVTSLLRRNAIFYKRQRCCECITMLSVLFTFTIFSLYIIFAHGFTFGEGKPFNLIHNNTRRIAKHEGDSVELLCQADKYWEWCRWIHMDKFCDFEWSPAYGVHKIGCDFPQGKVELFGDYHQHQCGIRVYDLDSRDRGTWMCEVEKYYTGFSRRYGEYRTNVLNLMISLKPTTTTIPASSVPSLSTSYATGDPTASALTPNSHQHGLNESSSNKNNNNATTVDPFLLEKEYEKQFLMLRICVLGTIGSVLSSLALMFWIYFMYLWRTWDSGKSRSGDSSGGGGLGHGGSQAVLLCEDGTTLSKRKSLGSMASDGTADDNDHDVDDGGGDGSEDYTGTGSGNHPHFDRALRRSRRKSVSFSIVKVNKETMQFDIEQKSVLLEDLSSTNNQTSQKEKPPASPLFEVAKKWKDAKNKLVLKEKKFFSHVPMLGTSISSHTSLSAGDKFEFKDENFRHTTTNRNRSTSPRELTTSSSEKAIKSHFREIDFTEKTYKENNPITTTTASTNNQELVVVVAGDKLAAVNDAVDVEDDAEAAALVEAGAAAAANAVVVKEDETAI